MAIKRTVVKQKHRVMSRDNVGTDSLADPEFIADYNAPEPTELARILDYVETELGGVNLRAETPDSPAYFARLLTRHVNAMRQHAEAGEIDAALDWAIALGKVFTQSLFVLNIEDEVVDHRRLTEARSRGATKASEKKKRANDVLIKRVDELRSQTPKPSVSAACLRVMNFDPAKAEALRTTYKRRRSNK